MLLPPKGTTRHHPHFTPFPTASPKMNFLRKKKKIVEEKPGSFLPPAMLSPEGNACRTPLPTRRRTTAVTRPWLVVSSSEKSCIEELGKQPIMRRTGLPLRDLRILDPGLDYPSSILGRDRAIVVNLESTKAIITADEVLVPNPNDPLVLMFTNELQLRLCSSYSSPKQIANISCVLTSDSREGSPRQAFDAHECGSTKALPFEFRVLQVCLESVCKCLESETAALEQEAYPALDELTSKINTLNLDRVRQLKSRLVALSGRVQKVRGELEQLLDDDMDMAEMYLTEKLAHQSVDEKSSGIVLDNGAMDLEKNRDKDSEEETESRHGSLGGFKPNVQELEMLLEAYFLQTEGILNKLSTLREYTEDTEDYINIMLDDKQNQLLQMGVMLSTATLVLTAGVVVTGIFGMNIHEISIFTDKAPRFLFWETTAAIVGGCIFIFTMAICWGKRSGFLQ